MNKCNKSTNATNEYLECINALNDWRIDHSFVNSSIEHCRIAAKGGPIMSEKKRFWILLGLLVLSIIWLLVARHYGSDQLLNQLQGN